MEITQELKLLTAIPGPKSLEFHKMKQQEVSHGVGTMLPVYIERAHGAVLVDVDGNQLIDLRSGIGVVTIGVVVTVLPIPCIRREDIAVVAIPIPI